MSDSRDKILAAARGTSGTTPESPDTVAALEQRIAAAIETVTPPTPDGLIKQFAEELEVVLAEFHHVGDTATAAQRVAAIMAESESTRLAVTGESETLAIAETVTKTNRGFEAINALELTSNERKSRLAEITTALTKAAFAVADMGSVVFIYDRSRTSQPYFLSDCVIVLVSKSDLVANHFTLLEKLDPVEAKNMVFVTGPSRTADIEKILILGAHGPRRLVILLLDD
jgi:L-lactate dehydrogenase complex protein LldG